MPPSYETSSSRAPRPARSYNYLKFIPYDLMFFPGPGAKGDAIQEKCTPYTGRTSVHGYHSLDGKPLPKTRLHGDKPHGDHT